MRDKTEIEKLADKAADEEKNPTRKRHGMTYEQGVRAALDWVLNEDEEYEPFE